jgi:hypothetical protein
MQRPCKAPNLDAVESTSGAACHASAYTQSGISRCSKRLLVTAGAELSAGKVADFPPPGGEISEEETSNQKTRCQGMNLAHLARFFARLQAWCTGRCWCTASDVML